MPRLGTIIGCVYWRTAHYDRAIADFTNAIASKPDYAEAYYMRGSAYHFKGIRDQAIADYRAALTDQSEDGGRRNPD